MLKMRNGKCPMRCLIAQCHEQITLAEPVIFKNTNQDY